MKLQNKEGNKKNMKKILASIIIAMMLISVGVNVFAEETYKLAL